LLFIIQRWRRWWYSVVKAVHTFLIHWNWSTCEYWTIYFSLIDLLFVLHLARESFSLWRRHHCLLRAAKP
jgi:hypothetical protein